MNNSETNQLQHQRNGESTNVATGERLLSIGAGTLVFTRSLGRSLPGALLGVALAYRGLAGHCHLYESLGVSTSNSATPPGEVRTTRLVTIDAEPTELYEFFIGETARFTDMMTHVAQVKRLSEERYHFILEGPIGNYEFTTRILDCEKPQAFSWITESGDIAHSGRVNFTPTPRGTELRVDIRYRVPGGELSKALARMTGMAPEETLERSLKQLKAKFETGEVPTIEGQPVGASRGRLIRDGATA